MSFFSAVKSLAKRNTYLKREIYKYKFRSQQPDWNSLLSKEADFWKTAREDVSGGQKVLIATSVGSHLTGTRVESSLAAALTLRGAQAEMLLCDGVLPACLTCWYELFPDFRQFAASGPQKYYCRDCFKPAERMFSSLNLPVLRYGDFLAPRDLQEIEYISQKTAFADIPVYNIKGIAAGEHALAGALRFLARGDLNNEPLAEPILRRFFKAALISAAAVENLLSARHYDCAVFHHGIYVPQGLIGEVCRKHGVRVVNWNPGYKKHTFIFSHKDTYHHTMISEPASKWEDIIWDAEKENRLMDYLESRRHGSNDWIWFHEKPVFSRKTLETQLKLDPKKPCIGLLTSVMWDAVLHYPSNAFSNMQDWLNSTIEYFIRRPDLQLIIRIHPAEVTGALPSRQKVADEIKRKFPRLPEHIKVILPGNKLSTYTLMSCCDNILIYSTKSGIEFSAMGKTVIVAGEAWIKNKGFSLDAKDKKQYTAILDSLPLSAGQNREAVLRAKKYAYHVFFRRFIPLPFIEPTKTGPLFEIRLNSLKELMPGEYKGLDVICNGILKQSDFIFDSE